MYCRKRFIHVVGIVAEVGDEHAGGEVVESAALGGPVVDTGAVGEDGLRRREGAERARFESTMRLAVGWTAVRRGC